MPYTCLDNILILLLSFLRQFAWTSFFFAFWKESCFFPTKCVWYWIISKITVLIYYFHVVFLKLQYLLCPENSICAQKCQFNIDIAVKVCFIDSMIYIFIYLLSAIPMACLFGKLMMFIYLNIVCSCKNRSPFFCFFYMNNNFSCSFCWMAANNCSPIFFAVLFGLPQLAWTKRLCCYTFRSKFMSALLIISSCCSMYALVLLQ